MSIVMDRPATLTPTTPQVPLASSAATAADDDLAVAAQAGRQDAVAELYRRYHPKVLTWLRRRAAMESAIPKVDVEDIAQDVFLRMMTTIGDYQPRPGTPFAAWLFGAVAKITLTKHQHYRWQQYAAVLGTTDQIQRGAVGATGTVNLAEPEHALSATVADALSRLTPSQRNAVLLRYVEGLTAGTAAAVSGSTEASVRMQCVKAVRILHRALADLAPTDAPAPEDLSPLKDVSARTGWSVSGLWTAIQEHRLTGYLINGRWMVTSDAVDAFVADAQAHPHRRPRPHRARPHRARPAVAATSRVRTAAPDRALAVAA